MADMRERGTSFLTASYDFAVKVQAIGLATGVITGRAFSTIASSFADDVTHAFGRILGGVDFSALVPSNPTTASVPSLTAAKGAGVTTLDNGVIINAMV